MPATAPAAAMPSGVVARTSSVSGSVGSGAGTDAGAGRHAPWWKPGVSAGASHRRSSSSSSHVTVSEQPAMSRLVTYSPTSGATIVTPRSTSRSCTLSHRTNSSSYLTSPRPLRSTAARPSASAGRSASTRSTSSTASAAAVGLASSPTPGSPWMPSPHPAVPGSRLNRAWSWPGSVHPSKATPNDCVRWLPRAARRFTSARSAPSSAAAPASLKTTRSPATPRRSWARSAGAEATSSVTSRIETSVPWARRRLAAAPKLSTSPA